MNHRKYAPPTDEEILSMNRVSVLDASRYLGMTYAMLSYKLQMGEMPFGIAEFKTKWCYQIFPKKLYNYKHGIVETEGLNIEEIIQNIKLQLGVLEKSLLNRV